MSDLMSTREPIGILLVDDQPAKLLSYEAILAPLQERLIKAGSGREALELLLKHEIAVVLMDVSMPGLDGFELAELIREHPRFQRTAIIFVSAVHLTDLDRLKGYESGAVDYVSVPVIPQILRAKVGAFAELYRQTREIERLNAELERRVAARTAELEASLARQAELAERLQEADRRKDHFLALLAHELRNPLAPVTNAVAIMRRKAIAEPELAWCRDVIERQTNQLSRLVDDLLDVSRITLGKIKLRKEPLDLSAVVADAVETSRPFIDAKGHQLTIAMPEKPIRLMGDPARLTQVIANLLNNAARYQAPGGFIGVSIAEEGGHARIAVRDRGIGIPPESQIHLFELFSQGEREPDSQGGLGIGLSLVKTLVGLHGGTVTAFSAGADTGSEFVVQLPALPPEPVRLPEPASESGLELPSRALRILVVDDSRDSAESLAMLLRMAGHEVFVAHDGLQAVELATAERPSVMLLDIGLPGMDGYEVCRRVRAQGLSNTLIVAMTGYGQDRDRQRSSEAGFNGHTVKPVEIEEITRLLATASLHTAS
jgi:signal transduction histidine kinase